MCDCVLCHFVSFYVKQCVECDSDLCHIVCDSVLCVTVFYVILCVAKARARGGGGETGVFEPPF